MSLKSLRLFLFSVLISLLLSRACIYLSFLCEKNLGSVFIDTKTHSNDMNCMHCTLAVHLVTSLSSVSVLTNTELGVPDTYAICLLKLS